jgi:C4-dicarboxylate-specific signal transduction histidine kinase
MSELAHLDRVAMAGELSASIVHEIAQPVGAMLVNANAGLRWASRPAPDLTEIREALGAVVNAGHRASDVLGSIRAMFKKEKDPEQGVIDVNGLITDVLALLESELQSKSVIVEVKLGKRLLGVYGNHVQLQQVIINVVMNAVEAMSSVQERLRKLQIGTAVGGPGDVLITVQDSGPGIAPDNIDRIFEHFFTTKAKGMGMGLAICKSIVENHNGRFWVQKHAEPGAVFQISLPGVSVTAE